MFKWYSTIKTCNVKKVEGLGDATYKISSSLDMTFVSQNIVQTGVNSRKPKTWILHLDQGFIIMIWNDENWILYQIPRKIRTAEWIKYIFAYLIFLF